MHRFVAAAMIKHKDIISNTLRNNYFCTIIRICDAESQPKGYNAIYMATV